MIVVNGWMKRRVWRWGTDVYLFRIYPLLDINPCIQRGERYVIIFNGEVYNFPEIKQDIDQLKPKHHWRGHSDTEIILEAFELWGIEDSLKRMVGMFAFALFDRQEQTLYLARDRMGEKPLYYGWQRGSFLFGSELKALRAHPDWENNINRDVIASYLRFNNLPETTSIYQGMVKLMPGTFFTDKTGWKAKPTRPLPAPTDLLVSQTGGACRGK